MRGITGVKRTTYNKCRNNNVYCYLQIYPYQTGYIRLSRVWNINTRMMLHKKRYTLSDYNFRYNTRRIVSKTTSNRGRETKNDTIDTTNAPQPTDQEPDEGSFSF